jgi:hypothetical protein
MKYYFINIACDRTGLGSDAAPYLVGVCLFTLVGIS